MRKNVCYYLNFFEYVHLKYTPPHQISMYAPGRPRQVFDRVYPAPRCAHAARDIMGVYTGGKGKGHSKQPFVGV